MQHAKVVSWCVPPWRVQVLYAHPTKRVWNPNQCIIWLGFVVDLALGQIQAPDSKTVTLQNMIEQAKDMSFVRPGYLASMLGKIISMNLAFDPVSRFMMRSLNAVNAVLESRLLWSKPLQLSLDAKTELAFWPSELRMYNAQPIWHFPPAVRVVYSDASDTGYLVVHGRCVADGQWTCEETRNSSTWRELSTMYSVLLPAATKVANAHVRWFIDNQNVVWILQLGSRKPDLHEIALRVFSLAVQYHIRLEPEWISRRLNELAGFLTRSINYDDWYLNPAVLAWLDSRWGPHTVNRFAHCDNCQLLRFNSKCWSPGSEAADTFTTDWSGENNWWCPPVSLVPSNTPGEEAARVPKISSICSKNGQLVLAVPLTLFQSFAQQQWQHALPILSSSLVHIGATYKTQLCLLAICLSNL